MRQKPFPNSDAKMNELPIEAPGVHLYQLLCGRDIAVDSASEPLFGVAAQMANFVYLVGCAETKQALLVDPAWDVHGAVDAADRLGYRVVGAVYTHQHFDHTGGPLPRAMTRGKDVCVQGIAELLERIRSHMWN